MSTRHDRIRRLAIQLEQWEDEHAAAEGITSGRLWWLADKLNAWLGTEGHHVTTLVLAMRLERWEEAWENARGIKPGRLWWLADKLNASAITGAIE